jgi:broad specificity phosphatase PhoE
MILRFAFLLKNKILNRVCEALEKLVNEAKAANVPCVAAVTHSAYLRVLVGMVLNEPLIRSSVRKIRNGSVTVVDVPKDLRSRMIGSKPKLLGGWLSQKPRDFTLSVPLCKTIRINEVRHLPLDKI